MFDELWPNGPKFHQAEYGFKLGTDSVLLAHFTNPTRAKKVLDLGCGAGVLTVLTAYKAPRAQVLGIEIQPESAAVCKQNMEANGFDPMKLTGQRFTLRGISWRLRTILTIWNQSDLTLINIRR